MSEAHRNYQWSKMSKRRREIARLNNETCSACGLPFAWDVHANSAWACTTDHPDILRFGGELLPAITDLGVHHRRCGGKQGAMVTNVVKGKRTKGTNRNRKTENENLENENAKIISLRPERRTPAAGGKSQSGRTGPALLAPDCPAPRLETPQPPGITGTLGPEWGSWLRDEAGIELRPWQQHVLDRALELDAEGRLYWRTIVLSTPRQSGKSVLAKALALARCRHADRFGEPQEIAHLANNVMAARRIHMSAWRWAEEHGLRTRRTMGDERLMWDDGSTWFISSSKAIWGASASMAIVDECWDLLPEVVTSAVEPILVERVQSQMWMISTANEAATILMPTYRARAMAGEYRTLLLEWSAPADANHADPAVWFAASPHWSPRRREMIEAAQGRKGWEQQWLSVWPSDSAEQPRGWPVGLSGCPSVEGQEAPSDGVGAVEVSQDRGRFGVALAVRSRTAVSVWTKSFDDLGRAVDWLNEHDPVTVFVGVSLKTEVEATASFLIKPAGTAETRQATPMMQNLIKRGLLAHDHGEDLMEESAGARVAEVESGQVLSARRSLGPIPVLKAASWAAWGASTGIADVEMPAIF